MYKVITDINTRNNNTVFDYSTLKNAENYINLIDGIEYLDHGSTALCYVDKKSNKVYKVCQKSRLDIGKFMETISISGVDILPIRLVFEDDNSFIYTQPKCVTLSKEDINYKFCRDVLVIVYSLLKNNTIYPDLYYKNFGYHNNKCYIFDCHDNNEYNNPYCSFYVVGLLSLFSLLFMKKDVTTMEEVEELECGKDILPLPFYVFIKDLYNRDFKNAKQSIKECIQFLEKSTEKDYNQYQLVSITSNGTIELKDHTLSKFNIAERVLKRGDTRIRTVLDAGCCIGGVGLKIAQENPSIIVTLNNITSDEVLVMESIRKELSINNSVIDTNNVIDINDKYDVTLYFALVHHLLRNYTISDILQTIKKQTRYYSVVEFPVQEDHLLAIVKSNSGKPENYKFLQTLGSLIDTICSFVNIEEVIRVEYSSPSISRYALVCRYDTDRKK